MMQKKIKIQIKEKQIIGQRSTSNKYKPKNQIKTNDKPISKINIQNNKDLETNNPIESTTTSESTKTTDTTKKIYVYRKNISKQKNSVGQIKSNKKRNINHCSSLVNINNNNKSNTFNTLENIEKYNNLQQDTFNNINKYYFDNYDKKINVNKINDTTPNRKYYKYNNYTINSGPNIFKKGINLNNIIYLNMKAIT